MQAKNLEELELQQPFIERTLRPLAARLSGSGPARHERVVQRSGPRSAWPWPATRATCASRDWLGIKAIGAVVGGILFFLLFVVVGVHGLPFLIGLLMIVVGVAARLHRPGVLAGPAQVKKRQKAILLMIPDALDLLTISVRAGLGFDAALGEVVEKLKGPLSDEFRRALAEVRVGKARREALRDIVPRTEVPPLTNFIGAIIQAEQLGVSISQGAPGPVRAAPHRAPPAGRGAGRQGADQDAVPARRLHLPVAVHRHPRPGHHPDRPEPGGLSRT